MNLYKELKKIGVAKSGKFILKSGGVSNLYIDMKKAFGSPEAFRLIVDNLCGVINKKATCIAGSGHGGLPLATAVAIRLELPLILVRDKIKNHGIQKNIDGYTPTVKDRVVIVDDIFTTGTCVSNMIKILKPTKCRILAGYVVANRGDASEFRLPIISLLNVEERLLTNSLESVLN